MTTSALRAEFARLMAEHKLFDGAPPFSEWPEHKQLRLIREAMRTKSPHASKSQEELVLEMDAADEVMTEMSLAIDRGVVYRKALYALLPVFFVAGVVVGKLWR